ncbi:MAG: aspartate dehydrogenase [Candidatus Methanoperedens sp.]|nr:aspartate dehydrogenase [Candidatus Methanoperedens sp.]MCE8428315.1 aspartate dehydrogenase [Candidatus Methanoperedens sp.]
MLNIGIIGCGAIGVEVCKAIDTHIIKAKLVGIFDNNETNCERLIRVLKDKPGIMSPADLIANVDIVVECASQAAVREFGEKVLISGKNLMVLSAGALLDSVLLRKLISAAAEHDCRIYVPSGAIAGLDGLKSANIASIERVVLTTTKSPAGLKGAPFIMENKIDLASIHDRTLLFEGNAMDAIMAFPANVNVAASLSLAGIGEKDTWVRIFVDPQASRNIHEITVEGAFGKFTGRIENVPSPANPRTSYLAALSAIATLKKITEPLQIGT